MMQNGDSKSLEVNTSNGGAYKWWALAVICVGTFTSTMDNSIINIALPTLGKTFNVGITTSMWVYLAYMLTSAGLTLTFGQSGDRWGRKRIYIYGLLISALGLGLNSIAQNMGMLISFRVVQAIGAGMMIAVGPAIITNVFPDNERGKAMGIYVGAVGAGLTMGPVLGGFLIDTLGWQSIFYVRLPIVLIVLALATSKLKEQKSGGLHHSFDKWGSATFFISMFTLLLGLNQSGERGWTSTFVLACLITAVASATLFIIIERKVAQPLLDLKLFRSLSFSMANLSLVLSFITRITAAVLLPFLLQDGLGYSASKTGAVQITIPVAMLIVSPFAGRLSDKIGSRILTTAGFSLIGLSIFLLSLINANSGAISVVLFLMIMGIGTGFFESPNNSLIMGLAPPDKRGIASAMLSTSRGLGLTVGLAISSSIYSARKALHLTQSASEAAASISSFHDALTIIVFLCIIGVIINIFSGNAKKASAV
jgi:EmrB/QacA subfamily drug resistance transporter